MVWVILVPITINQPGFHGIEVFIVAEFSKGKCGTPWGSAVAVCSPFPCMPYRTHNIWYIYIYTYVYRYIYICCHTSCPDFSPTTQQRSTFHKLYKYILHKKLHGGTNLGTLPKNWHYKKLRQKPSWRYQLAQRPCFCFAQKVKHRSSKSTDPSNKPTHVFC